MGNQGRAGGWGALQSSSNQGLRAEGGQSIQLSLCGPSACAGSRRPPRVAESERASEQQAASLRTRPKSRSQQVI